ncbi:hypothetical protein ACE4Z5_26575, partial [Salmonella enterica]|uniref:hypothetical protein n=1 Tax=Salmonella enterica TaxID=28901 RepID=UPI003D2C1FFB
MVSLRRTIGHAILGLGAALDWFTAPIKADRARALREQADRRLAFDTQAMADFAATNPGATIDQINRHL